MKKLLLLMLMAILMLPMAMKAQTTDITVGNGTNAGYYAPFGNYYEDSWDESIYPASAINAAGTITAVAYNCAAASSLTFNTLKIYMGTKTSSSHSDDNDWLPMSDLTLVYQGSNVTVGSTTGWQTFQLDVPYFYDGQDNLVIVVAKDQSGYSSSQTWYNTTSTGATLHYQADGDITYSQHPGTGYGDMYGYYPNVKLTINATPITCPAPTGLAVSTISDNSADLTWNAGGTESSWDIYVASSATDIPDENTNPTTTTSVNSYSMQGLTSNTNYKVYVRANCGAGDVSVWRSTSFLTPQVPAQMPYICDFEDASENSNWTLICNNTNKWVIGTAVNATDNGQSALYISNDNGTTNNYSHETSTAWAYRDIEFDNSYAEYHVSFDFKGVGESASYDNLRVYIGAPANPPAAGSYSGACPQGAVEIGNFHNEASWIHPEIVLNSSFTGVQRLYFLWWNDSGGGNPPAAAVDNLEVTGVNCGTPYNLALDTTTQTTIAFTFHPASPNDGSWQVILMNHGDTIDESQAITISDTAYEFTNLTPNTAYQIYVRTDCGSETSWWSSAFNVRTDCPEYITIPFTENFDTYGAGGSSYVPSCWTRMSTYNTSYPYISSTYNYSAPGSLYFYASSSSYTMIAMPEVDPSFPINTLTLSFMDYASGTTSSYAMQVGVLDGTTFTPVASVYPNAANTWCEQEIDFSSYTGNGQVIAFKFAPSGYYSHYIDNVSLYATPTCLKPVSVSASNVTDNSADISWMARSGESSWTVVAVPHGDDPATGTEEYAYSNPYTISNLTDNTQYDVYVKANCDDGESSVWSVVTSFTTKCLPTNVIPYIEDFNTYGMGSSSYFPNCWTRHQIGTTSIYPYISSTGGGSLYFYSSTGGISTYGASQALDLSAETPGSLALSFDIYKSSSSYGRMNVGYMTDADDINTFHLIKAFYPGDFDASSTWYNRTVVLPDAAYLPNVYLAFVAPAGASNYVYIDNVVVDYAQDICMAPSNVSISNIMGSSALVNWVALADQNDFVVEYSEHNMGNWTSVQATGSNVMLSGLSELTQYDVMVYASCASSYSDTVTATFTTRCNAGGEVAIGTGTTTEYYYPVNNYYNYSYTQQIYTAAEMNGPTTINGVSFQYSYSTSSSKNSVNIYLGHTTQSSFSSTSDYIPATNLQLVYSGNLNCHQGWNDFSFSTPFQYNGTDNLVIAVDDNSGSYSGSSYTFYASPAGATRTIYYYSDSSNPDIASPSSSGASSSTASNRVNIKFLASCDSSATCFRPNMYVESYDDQSITVAWAAGGYENSWELRYHSASDASNWITETVTASPFVITNLDASETYTIQMRSDCGGEYSDWIGAEVTTACEYVTNLPYTEDFESAAGSGAAYFVDCWTRGTNSSTQYPYCSSSYNATASGSKSLYFYGSSSNYCYAATPRFDDSIEMDSLQIQFMGKATSSGYFLEVGIMTNPNDYNTFVPVGTFSPSSTNFESGEINTNSYSGNGHYVAFRIPQWASSYIYLDDIHINYIPNCLHINNLHTTAIAGDGFTCAWIPGDSETAWDVIVEESVPNMDPNDYTPNTVYDNTYVAENLNAGTYYTVFVRANCDNGESSEWTSIQVKTAQNPASLPYFCDFENVQENNNWDIINSTVVNEWHIGTATNNGGSHAMYISQDNGATNSYNTSSACVVWAYRDIYFPACPSGYRMSFDWRCTGESSYDYMKVYWGIPATPTPATSSTITVPAGATVIPNTSSTEYYNQQSSYVKKTIDLPALTTSGVRRIYFCWRQDGSAGTTPPAAVDNISINAIYCDAPMTNLTVDNVSAYSADISWTDAVSSDWTIEYAAEGDATWTVDNMASNPYTLTNLMPQTNYTVRVAANCGDGNISPYVITTFKTACVALTQVPFEENFDSYPSGSSSSNVLPDCWSMLNTGTSSVGCPTVYSSSTYASSGSNVLYFYSSSSTSYADQYAILPPVDPTVLPLQGLRLSFKARRYTTTTTYVNTIIVGVMSNPADASSFVPVDTVELLNTTIESHHVDFNNYVGNGTYVAIMVPKPSGSYTYNYNYIDDVKLDIAPSCGNPTDFTATLTGATDVTLSWNDEPGESTWQLLMLPASATADFSQAQTLNTNSYSESGLAANTAYQAYIRTQCSNGLGYSEWISTTFSTPSANPAQLPYYNGFEDGAENAEWAILNTTTANKWYIGKPSGQADSALYISKDNGATNSYDGNNANVVWVYRDIQLPVAAEYQIRLKWKCNGESSFDYMYAYLGNPNDVNASTSSTIVAPANAIQLGGDSYRFNQNTSWSWFTETVSSSIGSGVKRLYFAWRNDGSVENQPPIMIDSIEITASNCGSPYNLAVSAISTTTADVTFSPAMPTDNIWEYVISTSATFNPDMETPNTLSYNTINISGLTANTTYYVYVRTLCSDGTYSSWSDKLTFTTACDDITTIPYTENFDTYGTGEGTFPNCWAKINTYSYDRPYVSSTNYAGVGSLYFFAGTSGTYNMAVMPPFDASIAINTLQASFKLRGSYSSDRIIVGVMTNPLDASTFVPVDTVPVGSNYSSWIDCEVLFSNYTGNGQYIAFKNEYATTSAYAYIDNLTIDMIPTCPRPRNLAASNMTTSSIDLSWTEMGSATQWNIEYGPAGFTQGNGTIVPASTNPFTVTGLNTSTNYDFYVQSDCGGGDVSPWSDVLHAATDCGAMALPYVENFDSYSGTNYSTPGPTPTCWTTWTNNTTYPAPHVTSSGTGCYPSSGTNALTFIANSSSDGVTTGASAIAILPTFTDDLNTLKISFAYRMENSSYGELRVGYVTNPSSPLTTFTQVATLTGTTTVTTDSIDFSTVTGVPANGNIAFYWYKESTWYTCSIDDINVTSNGAGPGPGTTCDVPTNLAVSNITTTGATATWTAGGGENAWNLQYKLASAANWSNSIPVTTPSYTFAGLTPNTQYQVRVQAACDATTTSDWTAAVSFTTAQESGNDCAAPSNLTATEVNINTITLTWTENGTATSWTVYFRVHGATAWTTETSNATTYTLTGLEAQTQYDIQVVANCADGETSEPSNTVNPTTTVGINDYVESNVTVAPNPTTGVVRVSSSKFQVSGVDVYDVYGKLLNTMAVNDGTVEVDLGQYAAGVYFLRISTENGVVTKRVVKR